MDKKKIRQAILTKMSKVITLEDINRILNAYNLDAKQKIILVKPFFTEWFKENFSDSDMKNKKVMSKYIKYRA